MTAVRRKGAKFARAGVVLKAYTTGLAVPARQLVEVLEDHGLERNDLAPYLPPTPDAVSRWGGEVRYLGYYLKWTPQWAYYYAVENLGFEANPERTEGTYSKYNSLDDRIDGFHYYTTYIKFGLGRATYDASQEIRNHHITREEGVALVRRFDGEYRWVETRAAPMRNAEGAIVQWNVICLDIDGEVQAQEELRLTQEGLARASQAASLADTFSSKTSAMSTSAVPHALSCQSP